jgi:uncharacterized protein (TIGR02466 family)
MEQPSPMNSNTIQARWHFAVPVYEKLIADFFPRQQRLIDTILAMRQSDTGIRRSNQGGWHSDDRLLYNEDNDIRWLMQAILKMAAASIHDFEKDRAHGNPLMTIAWANINNTHDWNQPHQHLPADWSGVFYVSVDEAKERTVGKPAPGDILFFNPAPQGDRLKSYCTISYPPKNGLLLLFPAFLMHMVTPHTSENPRISISFNIRVPLSPEEIKAAEQLQKQQKNS